jgi:hypothetical protein
MEKILQVIFSILLLVNFGCGKSGDLGRYLSNEPYSISLFPKYANNGMLSIDVYQAYSDKLQNNKISKMEFVTLLNGYFYKQDYLSFLLLSSASIKSEFYGSFLEWSENNLSNDSDANYFILYSVYASLNLEGEIDGSHLALAENIVSFVKENDVPVSTFERQPDVVNGIVRSISYANKYKFNPFLEKEKGSDVQ